MDDDTNASFSSLGSDILANIFGHLPLNEIVRSRRLCKASIDAVKETVTPLGWREFFEIDGIEKYNALVGMAESLPGLQQIRLKSQSYDSEYTKKEAKFKYNDGEDPIESAADSDDDGVVTLNIDDVLGLFPKLHTLAIHDAPLNGRYSSLFNMPHLQKLSISCCKTIKFDFGMLAGLPSLTEFECVRNKLATGSLGSLSVCKDTLERVELSDWSQVVRFTGDLMDVATFPCLKSLNLVYTKAVSGNLGDIDVDNDDHFPMIEELSLPETVIGGSRYEVMHIDDAKQLIKDLTPLRRKRPDLFKHCYSNTVLKWSLSKESPDTIDPSTYQDCEFRNYTFFFVQSGEHLGWRFEQSFDYTPGEYPCVMLRGSVRDESYRSLEVCRSITFAHISFLNFLHTLPCLSDRPFEVHWFGHVPDAVARRFIPSGMGRFYKGYYVPPPYNVHRRLERQYCPCAAEMQIMMDL